MAKQKLTKRFVDSVKVPGSQQLFYWDTVLPGFGLRVGKTQKAFIAEARLRRKSVRVTIGTYPRMTCEQARLEARRVLSSVESGVDPRVTKEAPPLLSEAFDRFTRVRTLAPRTLADYTRYLTRYLTDWQTKPVSRITASQVSQRHMDIAGRHGQAQANAAMRFLRSLIYFSRAEYGKALVGEENPVLVLGAKRQWFREPPRQGVIKAHQLSAWFAVVRSLANDETTLDRETARDLLQLCLFLGLRKSEAMRLRKSDVDMRARQLVIKETKSYRPRTIPFGAYVSDMLELRLSVNPLSPYVFGSTQEPTSPVADPKRTVARVARESDVTFSLHDLRRSFATYLEGLDVSVYATRRLLGHKTRSDDTLGRHYVVTDVERLRSAVEKLESFILRTAGVEASAPVVAFERRS